MKNDYSFWQFSLFSIIHILLKLHLFKNKLGVSLNRLKISWVSI